jgi:peptide chain release factor 1
MKDIARLRISAWYVFSQSTSSFTLLISGKNVAQKFSLESGIHRVQRCPPTENKGRRHTSTMAVAVMPYVEYNEYQLDMSEFTIECYCGGGPGGQHRNTTNSNVKIIHKPTGLTSCANTKSQHRNKQIALSVLVGRINEASNKVDSESYSKEVKSQIRDTGRGTRIRTYNFIESRVKDERVSKKFRTQDIMKGKLTLIYNEYLGKK